ncbi:MAG TPA: ABC-F family ATP-binding cassette domain-containing protein [Candidatus Sulfomarinibacteraceae bacterium]|nr:ABC-F family ATP-binding cassette domain-containing protein [Candidatus Sulfomarinibacteraceae bacterium]
MLTVHQISKSFDFNPILQDVTFHLNAGERVGLIGPNGSGKTTLLRILAGEEQPDSGHLSFASNAQVGYLAQSFELPSELSLAHAVGRAAGDPDLLQAELERLANALAQNPEQAGLQKAYDRALQQLSSYDPARVEVTLQHLGLSEIPGARPVGQLSGGQKTRLTLALILLQEPDLLLLDEPTNHLDVAMLEWLERWLSGFEGGVLLVSHDRTFLDHTVNRILALNPVTHTVAAYEGNYSDYVQQRRLQREKQWSAYKDQQYEIRRMRQDINRIKQQARGTEQATKNDQLRRYAKKVARKAKSREKKLDRYLESDERVEKPARHWKMKLDFDEPTHLSQDVLNLEALTVGYEGHPPLLRDLNLHVQAGQRIVLTGPNGSGKTTLLRTIAGRLPPQAGRVRLGASVKMGYMTQEQKLLDPDKSALELIQRAAPLNETDARSFLHYFLFSDDDPLRPTGDLSFGERARLALALLVARGCNFLLLDEPINHLDIPSRTGFEQALAQFEGTTLAVVHDRYFIDRFATDVWLLEDASIRRQIRDR